MRKSKKSQHLITIAQNYMNQSNFPQAIKILDQAIQIDPAQDQAYRLKGDCFEQLDQKEEAEKNYSLCLQRNPFSVICYTNYGLLLYRMGKKTEAQKMYELCLQINPKDPTCLNNYSILLMETGQIQKAEQVSKKCLEVDPTNQNCLMNIGKIAMSKQNSFSLESQISQILLEEQKQKLESIVIEKDHEILKFKKKIEQQDRTIQQKDSMIEDLRDQLRKIRETQEIEEQKSLCKICFHKKANYINNECGHLCTCFDCLRIVGRACPICRKEGRFMRVFGSLIKEE